MKRIHSITLATMPKPSIYTVGDGFTKSIKDNGAEFDNQIHTQYDIDLESGKSITIQNIGVIIDYYPDIVAKGYYRDGDTSKALFQFINKEGVLESEKYKHQDRNYVNMCDSHHCRCKQ